MSKDFTPLTYKERLDLIPALVEIARVYYEAPLDIDFRVGICFHLVSLTGLQDGYSKMSRLMKELGDNEEYFGETNPYYFTDIQDWESRAILCLLVSEYLFQSLDESVVTEPLFEAPVTTFVEKVVNVGKTIRGMFAKGGNVCTN